VRTDDTQIDPRADRRSASPPTKPRRAEPRLLTTPLDRKEAPEMIRAGDTVVNPVTGEKLVWELTSHDTDGAYTLFDTYVEPGGAVATAHVHPYQTEIFTVVSGRLGVKRGREKLELGPGEVAMIDPGVAHKFWNAGDETLCFRAEVRPALDFESLIETMFGLAADGKTNRKGMPNPFRLAVIANRHFDTVRLPVVPSVLQKAALVPGALLGRALGYEPTYEVGGGSAVLACPVTGRTTPAPRARARRASHAGAGATR